MNRVPSYCALEGWRAQYASPVVETTVVGPQYGTTTMLAIQAQAAAVRGELPHPAVHRPGHRNAHGQKWAGMHNVPSQRLMCCLTTQS